MIPELGQLALSLALAVSLFQCVIPLVGARKGNVAWMALARPAAQGQALLIAFAFGCLVYSFAANDFSVQFFDILTKKLQNLPALGCQPIILSRPFPPLGIALTLEPSPTFHAMKHRIQCARADFIPVPPKFGDHPLAVQGCLAGMMQDVNLPEA